MSETTEPHSYVDKICNTCTNYECIQVCFLNKSIIEIADIFEKKKSKKKQAHTQVNFISYQLYVRINYM